MKENFYLTFSLNNFLYSISTVCVEEVFPLPELTPITQAGCDIVGVVNLRGDLLAVIDLNPRLGYQSPDYRLTDSIVVLKSKELRIGIIVNEVYDIIQISLQEISSNFDNEVKTVKYPQIIAGVFINTRDIFILSNPDYWFEELEIQQLMSMKNLLTNEIADSHQVNKTQINSSDLLLLKQSTFCPNATPKEQEILRQRADNLRFSIDNPDLKSLITIAVISLNGNLFGVDVAMVREFTEIYQVRPIPCCPVQIIGNMNLRGEIITLVDIRGLLNLPLTTIIDSFKVMVVEVEGIVAGVIVEEVYDAMFLLKPQQIKVVPTATHSIHDEYFQGVAPYHEAIMTILDLPTIFLKGGLIVDEVI
ncbi:MAG: chemotaxis protein CheW [Symploca sp. SIO3C6]|nr:chemotaxis protein CheW [Symploca sp. SIO3C6]